MGKNGETSVLYFVLFTRLHAAQFVFSCWKLSTRWSETISRDDRPSISTHGQPASCRARPRNVDEGLEDIRWIRGLEGERLPAASYALFQYLKKGDLLSSVQNVFVSVVWPRSAIYHRPCVNTATRGWVGAPNERDPFRFHDGVFDLVDGYLWRTRNPAASSWTFSWVFLNPVMCFFFRPTFFFFLVLISERYINVMVRIFLN